MISLRKFFLVLFTFLLSSALLFSESSYEVTQAEMTRLKQICSSYQTLQTDYQTLQVDYQILQTDYQSATENIKTLQTNLQESFKKSKQDEIIMTCSVGIITFTAGACVGAIICLVNAR